MRERENDHVRGVDNPAVILIEYGDYECPYSAKLAPVIQDLLEEFKFDLSYIYRHFPMVNIHSNSGLAALAAEAADEQSKFWEMHSLLFENYDSLSTDDIMTMAKGLGLNMKHFRDDLEDEGLWDKAHADNESGIENNITGTPTLYLNGSLYQGSSTYVPLKKAIIEEMERKGTTFHA